MEERKAPQTLQELIDQQSEMNEELFKVINKIMCALEDLNKRLSLLENQ